jgi:hypothetical protein
MDTHASFIPHEHPLVGVDEVVDFSGHFPFFFPVSSGWCSVSVWENNLGLQGTKPVIFLNCLWRLTEQQAG